MTQASYVSLLFAPGLVGSQTDFSGGESELMDLTSADVLAELIMICSPGSGETLPQRNKARSEIRTGDILLCFHMLSMSTSHTGVHRPVCFCVCLSVYVCVYLYTRICLEMDACINTHIHTDTKNIKGFI